MLSPLYFLIIKLEVITNDDPNMIMVFIKLFDLQPNNSVL